MQTVFGGILLTIISSTPDNTIRDLSSRDFKYERALPAHCLVLEENKDVELDIPYPGPSGVFVQLDRDQIQLGRNEYCDWNHLVHLGKWEDCNVIFESTTDSSILKSFIVSRDHKDYPIGISVIFREDGGCFAKYLRAHGLDCQDDEAFWTDDPTEVQMLFRIITVNNTIPPEDLSQFQTIVERL